MTTGQCSPTCFPRQTCCGDTCVDTQNDPSSCGGRGTACQAYHMCTNGSCDLCPSEPIDYVTCPVNDPGGHIVAVCCRPETPNCCFGSRGGGGCCGDDTTCCLTPVGDGYCCPAGTQCCANSNFYPCLPADTPCP
jgi:hypothetical protein